MAVKAKPKKNKKLDSKPHGEENNLVEWDRIIRKSAKDRPKKVRPVEDALAEYKKIIDARYRVATSTYENQDDLTKEVIDRICDRLRIASTGVVMVNGRPFKLDPQWIDFNILFLACEILSDLAINGIKIANFKPNPLFCIECKKEILGVKEPKRSRRGRR